ncbi:MAG: hypothetical protein K2J73_04335, partial [Oscillospiraceae bacterium]|nr:hypothetical protein [Oscillospiraceae bacterium]
MSDGKYSVDDILNEYTDRKSGDDGKKSFGIDSDINIDDLIGGFATGNIDIVKNSISESAYISEGSYETDNTEPDSDGEVTESREAYGNGMGSRDGGDSFSGKYDKLFSAVT